MGSLLRAVTGVTCVQLQLQNRTKDAVIEILPDVLPCTRDVIPDHAGPFPSGRPPCSLQPIDRDLVVQGAQDHEAVAALEVHVLPSEREWALSHQWLEDNEEDFEAPCLSKRSDKAASISQRWAGAISGPVNPSLLTPAPQT